MEYIMIIKFLDEIILKEILNSVLDAQHEHISKLNKITEKDELIIKQNVYLTNIGYFSK